MNERGIKRLKKYERSRVKGNTPFEVCLTNPEERNDNESLYIADYLMNNIEYFKKVDLDLMPYISKHLSAKHFKKGELIIKKGDDGDCMYVLYKGLVEVILGEEYKGDPILMEDGRHFGHTALEKDEKRSASIIAKTNCETLVLYKTDFDKVVKEQMKLRRINDLIYLKGLEFFKTWNPDELNKLNNCLESTIYKPN